MEIRKSTKSGRHFLVHEEMLYQLEPEGSEAHRAGSVLRGRDRGLVTGLLLEYAEACESLGIIPHYSWRGVVNSLGDVGDKRPPWKPIELHHIPNYIVLDGNDIKSLKG